MSVDKPELHRRGLVDDAGLTALVGLLCAFALLYSNFATFLTARYGLPATPVYGIVMLCGLALLTGVVRSRPLLGSSKIISAALFTYIVIAAVQIVFTGPPPGDVLKFRVMWAVVTIAAIVCLSNTRLTTFLQVIRVVCALSIAMMFLEYVTRFAPAFRISTVVGRAAGFFMNPNSAALFLAAAVPVVTFRSSGLIRTCWYGAIAAATLISFSRGGMLLCLTMIVLTELFPASAASPAKFGRRLVLVLFAGVIFYLSLDLVMDVVLQTIGSSLDSNTANRLRFGLNESSQARLYVIRLALEVAQDSILFGHGIGFANVWGETISVHNIFVLVLLEQGVLGIVWLLGLLSALLTLPRPFGLWVTTVLLVGGMFNHNLFDSPTYGMLIAMYAALPAAVGVPQRAAAVRGSRSPRVGHSSAAAPPRAHDA